MAPRARFELATLRLTAEVAKNLSAASGVAYIRLGAILTLIAAPNAAPTLVTGENSAFAANSKPELAAHSGEHMLGIPVKLNAHSEGKPNGIPG